MSDALVEPPEGRTNSPGTGRIGDQPVWRDANSTRALVDSIVQETVLIERSPPQAMPISEVVKAAATKGGSIVTGVFVGYAVAPESALMFLTIPIGIVVVGSAVGISRGLENGLQFFIESLFKGEEPEPPKPDGPRPRRRNVNRRIANKTASRPAAVVLRTTKRGSQNK